MAIKLDALGEAGPFNGFFAEDFDAFEKKKWASRVYTMERRAVLQKLLGLARAAREPLPDLESYDLGTSDDAPSMVNGRKVSAGWAYITRAPEARKTLASRVAKTNLSDAASLFDIAVEHEHASLLLAVDLNQFGIELHISPKAAVDRTNAERKLGYREDREALTQLLSEIP